MIAAVSVVQAFTFVAAGVICLAGALGVVALKNPVHNALSLIATLFGIAVLYVSLEAYFLAAIQVIVYAGAIVVLFLFVIMLLGVDKTQSLASERDPVTLLIGGALGAGLGVLVLVATLAGVAEPTGERSVAGVLDPANDLNAIAQSLFTRYVFAFEITSLLLTIAVVGAVVLSRKPKGAPIDLDEFPAPDFTAEDIQEAEETAAILAAADGTEVEQ